MMDEIIEAIYEMWADPIPERIEIMMRTIIDNHKELDHSDIEQIAELVSEQIADEIFG